MDDTLHALIVEDSVDDALLVLRELRRHGFTVVWERVETAEALHQALTSDSWDVLISDYRLPGFDAPAALDIVKQRQLDIPFIVVSGTIGEVLAVKLMKAGAHDYLMKDNLARLPEAVRREVREAHLRAKHHRDAIALDEAKERLQLALEGSGIGLWDWSVPTGAVTFNERWAEISGYTLEELTPTSVDTWRQLTHPEDLQKADIALGRHFRQETPIYECELRMHHKLGLWVWVLARGKVVEWDAGGNPLRMTGTHLDISDRKQAELRLELQNSILQRIAKAEPLADILAALVRATEEQLEEQLDGGICSILLCDRQGKLHSLASPQLPKAYSQSIEGLAMGEGMGSCGTAAFRREAVIVTDIATDPLWQNYRQIALHHGLRSCWSMPVIASDGSVLATFAVYHRTPHRPRAREIEIVTLVTNIAKIAIEREQATQSLEQLNRDLENRVAQRTAALQRSEARLREAQQVAHLGSWELDVQTQKITWSAEIFSIFGLSPEAAEPTYEQLFENHFPEDERARYAQIVARALDQGESYETDLQIMRADGSLGDVFVKAAPVFNAAGEVTRLFGIAMDISDRKAIQAALQRSEERARATLLALPDLVFRVNAQGQYQDFLAAPGWGNVTEPHQAIGKRMEEIMPPQPQLVEAQYLALRAAIATQTVQIYEQQLWVDGHLRDEEVRVAPCGNDEVVFFVRNISDRKQAERIIRQQAEREFLLREITQRIRQSLDLQTIFDTAVQEVRQFLNTDRVGIFKFDPLSNFDDGEFVAESIGPDFDTLMAVKIHDHCFGERYAVAYQEGKIHAVDDIHQAELADCHIRILSQFQVRANLVVPLLTPDGLWGLLCIHQCAKTRHWQPSEIAFTQQLANQLAIAIQQANLFEQLQQELAERQQAEAQLTESNHQLAISNQELARATRLKDEFLANMSHELRTPLNAILGMTEALQEGVFGPVNLPQIKALKTVERSGSHLLELINDILDVAKIEAGRIELDYVSISAAYLCRSSLTFIKQQALQKRIQLEFKLQPHLPDLRVDERRIRQVLINLLNNAVKFTPEGGRITLEVTPAPAPLPASARSCLPSPCLLPASALRSSIPALALPPRTSPNYFSPSSKSTVPSTVNTRGRA